MGISRNVDVVNLRLIELSAAAPAHITRTFWR
jgi:hypothetical protein